MKESKIFVLIAIALLMVALTGFNYATTENIVDLEQVQMNKEIRHPLKWSVVIRSFLLVGGIVVLVFSKRGIK